MEMQRFLTAIVICDDVKETIDNVTYVTYFNKGIEIHYLCDSKPMVEKFKSENTSIIIL